MTNLAGTNPHPHHPPQPGWQVAIAQLLGAREEQQDRAGHFPGNDAQTTLLVLCDGLGGLADGGRAADLAVAVAGQCWADVLAAQRAVTEPAAFLGQVCERAHHVIRQAQSPDSAMGTTLVAALCGEGQIWWAHVGDSRFYLLRDGAVIQRTRDHSLAELIGPSHPRNILMQCLGGDSEPTPSFGHAHLRNGDVLALASDGLWEGIGDDELAAVVSGAALVDGLQDTALALTKLAEHRNGAHADNTTVLLAHWRLPQSATRQKRVIEGLRDRMRDLFRPQRL